MSPQRLFRRRYIPLFGAASITLLAFWFASWAIQQRSEDLNRILHVQQELTFDQCVANEIQDAVIVDQLRAAKRRARATTPPGPLLRSQLQAIDDGIATLEPTNEPECTPPEGTSP